MNTALAFDSNEQLETTTLAIDSAPAGTAEVINLHQVLVNGGCFGELSAAGLVLAMTYPQVGAAYAALGTEPCDESLIIRAVIESQGCLSDWLLDEANLPLMLEL